MRWRKVINQHANKCDEDNSNVLIGTAAFLKIIWEFVEPYVKRVFSWFSAIANGKYKKDKKKNDDVTIRFKSALFTNASFVRDLLLS